MKDWCRRFMETNNRPKNWVSAKLSDLICKNGLFCDGDWIESKDQDVKGQVRLIQLADIGDGEFKNKSNRYMTMEKAKELRCTFLTEGDILIARMPEPLGRSCIFSLKGDDKFVTVVDVAVLRIDSEYVNNKYISYILNSPQSRDAIVALESGTTRKRISRRNLATIMFPLPPLAEQQRIANRISELFSEVDKTIESLKVIQQQLEVYQQAILKSAFQGKLVKLHSEEPTFCKLENYCEFITKGTTPSKEDLYSNEGEVPFLKVYNLTFDTSVDFSISPTFITKETHTNFLKRSRVLPGDVLMNIVGPPLGKVSIVPSNYSEWNINQAIVRFRCKEKLYNKYLAYFLLCKDSVRKLEKQTKATAGQRNLTLEQCRNIEIPIYPIEEQYEIVNEIEMRLSVYQSVERTVSEALERSEKLKQSILKKAFEGKLVPQDPNDEPAEKLIERIKAEKLSL